MGNIRMKALEKADKALSREVIRQNDIILPAVCLALYRDDGWRKIRLRKLIELARECWEECGEDPNLSILLMVEDEIGIEMQNGNGVSFHDLHYLSGRSTMCLEEMTPQQYMMMRIKQKEWVGTLIMGSILLAMHRKEGYGPDRCARLMQRVQEITSEHHWDPDRLHAQLVRETGYSLQG